MNNQIPLPERVPLHLFLLYNGYELMNMSLREMERSVWIPLKKFFDDGSKEKIMVHIKRQNNKNIYLYYNMDNDGDRGNIINYAKNRNLNLKNLMKLILEFEKNGENFNHIKIAKPIQSINIIKEYQKLNPCDIYNNPLFEKRLIHVNIIEEYKNQIKEDNYGNACIPNYYLTKITEEKSIIGLVGFTKRLNNPILKDEDGNFREKPLKNIQRGNKGFEMLKPSGEINYLIITESIIDSLSYLQFFSLPPRETMLISTSGNFSIEKFKKTFDFMFEKHIKKEIDIHIATDNDETGREFRKKLENYFFEKTQRIPTIYIPFSKDMNDDLKLKHFTQLEALTKKNIQSFLEKTLSHYSNTKYVSNKNLILEKIGEIDKIIGLPENFKKFFTQKSPLSIKR